jgi:hypothetical protein
VAELCNFSLWYHGQRREANYISNMLKLQGSVLNTIEERKMLQNQPQLTDVAIWKYSMTSQTLTNTTAISQEEVRNKIV